MDQNDRLVILVLVVGILLGILFGAFAATAAGSVIAQFIIMEQDTPSIAVRLRWGGMRFLEKTKI